MYATPIATPLLLRPMRYWLLSRHDAADDYRHADIAIRYIAFTLMLTLPCY